MFKLFQKFLFIAFAGSIVSIGAVKANLDLAPPSFKYRGMKAIWVDFISAHHDIVYDHKQKTNLVKSKITFKADRVGYPLFDLVPSPKSVLLDGRLVPSFVISLPQKISKVNIIGEKIKPGIHTLEIVHQIKIRVKYRRRGVHSAFWIRDLTSRKFIEQYIPTNFEFDQYQIKMNVKVNSKNSHNIFTNGDYKEIDKNHFQITYPGYYTASSPYFHLVPKSKYWRLRYNFTSSDGRKIPVRIYSRYRIRNKRLLKKAKKVLKELEKDYGPWPHQSLLIYGVKLRGGMEYVGATTTSYRSLGHELLHGYFAKGAMPANGNSGWLDEAIASWRDYGYQTLDLPFYHSANLAAHSPFRRNTDDRSYKYGRSFLAHLNFVLKANGKENLKFYLKQFGEEKMFQIYETKDFIKFLEEKSGMQLDDYFNQYVFGFNAFHNVIEVPYQYSINSNTSPSERHHFNYTEEELDSIL